MAKKQQALSSLSGSAALVILAFFALLIVPQATIAGQQEVSGEHQEKQKKAEEAADRILQRFYETLDFGVIYREMFVTNPELRELEVEAIVNNLIRPLPISSPHKREIDFAAKERAYVAIWNFWWLASAAALTTNPDKEELEGNLKEPYESLTRMKPEETILTSADLDRYVTAVMNGMGDYLRKHVARENFNSPEYKEKVSRIKENQSDEADHLRELFQDAGLKPDTEIYVVRREKYYYYLIEEEDSFRLLTFSSRVRF